MNRRQFLQASALTSLASGPFLMNPAKAAPSNRLRIGFIACGGRARKLMNIMRYRRDVEIPIISDVIEPRMDRAADLLTRSPNPQKPDRVVDHRRVLDRSDLDAVVIATTQHWHGRPHIQACQAGLPVYIEKPLSHTVAEGRAMVDAAKKHDVLAMMGTQQRAGTHYQKAVEHVRSGRLGKVAYVECWNYHNTGNRVGRPEDTQPPEGYHWDHWLGPAPEVPFNRARLSHAWWYDYGGGMLTNWAVHHIDIILWAMQSQHPTEIGCFGGKYVVNDMADTPDTIDASWQFSDWLMEYRYRGFNNFHTVQSRPHHHGICFHGDKATLVVDRYGYELREDGSPDKIAESRSCNPYFSDADPDRSELDGPWQRRFLDVVKGDQQLPLTLEESHQATVCCHLANIAYRAKARIRWDGQVEKILDNPEAAAYLTEERRAPYILPSV